MVNYLEKKKVEEPPIKIQSHYSLLPMKEPLHTGIKVGRVELLSNFSFSLLWSGWSQNPQGANISTPTEKWWVQEEGKEYQNIPLRSIQEYRPFHEHNIFEY